MRSSDVVAALERVKPVDFQARDSGRLDLAGYGEHIKTSTVELRIAEIG